MGYQILVLLAGFTIILAMIFTSPNFKDKN